nr:isoleucine--tRNA ligase [Candidatus Cyanaurora vandensis]
MNLPKTDFAMRANAPQREPELQQFWADQRIYETLAQREAPAFVLHDGPPYANGGLHMGHGLNKILKDTINRYWMLRGRRVNYVPGWDCHGLPIELKVLQNLKTAERQALTPLGLRQRARAFALATVAEQKVSFRRLGVWGDWEQPYLTLNPTYEAAQVHVFGQMALKGYIYRALKPVYWSPSSRTALAEAELEYPEDHISRSIYVRFLVQSGQPLPMGLSAVVGERPLYVALWTTTPWTIPGNLAVCLNPGITYVVVESATWGLLVVAQALVERLAKTLDEPLTPRWTGTGESLAGLVAQHPLYDRPSPLILGDHVTTESGTGLVHTAPGHGSDDFVVGQRYGLGVLSPVDALGNFTDEVAMGYTGAVAFTGLNVLGEGNTAVIEALGLVGALLKAEDYNHKYPYDWRTKKPVILRATTQWFASVESFREQALQAIQTVQWIPQTGLNRIVGMVAERSDWCISRQRDWGVPIPVFYDEATDEFLLNAETLAHVEGLIAEHGSDCWWELPVAELLPPRYHNDGHTYRKGRDTMDVWFDSGSSWAAVLGQRPELQAPADLYLEGSDQHRGWFQSSLLTSVAVSGEAPYRTVLTHGFVLDEQGHKMSKSLGNVVDPQLVIAGGKDPKKDPPYGADVLRLWVSSVDYTADMRLGRTALSQQADLYRKIRNTCRYLLSNLYDFTPLAAVDYAELPRLERYILHRLAEVVEEVTDAFARYQFYRFYQTVQNFCVVDLSNFYLDIAKDSLYISTPEGSRRRSAQTVLYHVLETLTRLIAPVLCHLAEDIWQHLPYPTDYPSVFLAGWPAVSEAWRQPELAQTGKELINLRNLVTLKLEEARTERLIGSSLEAKVCLTTPLALDPAELRYLFIVSQVELVTGVETRVQILRADGQKCPRCWNYSAQIGVDPHYPEVCERCGPALAGEF